MMATTIEKKPKRPKYEFVSFTVDDVSEYYDDGYRLRWNRVSHTIFAKLEKPRAAFRKRRPVVICTVISDVTKGVPYKGVASFSNYRCHKLKFYTKKELNLREFLGKMEYEIGGFEATSSQVDLEVF